MTKRKRRRLFEVLESRRVLDAVGIDAAPEGPAWESVIVALQDDVTDPRGVAHGMVSDRGGQLGHVFQNAVKGFSAQLPAAAVRALSNHPQVKRIEPDLVMKAFAQRMPTGVDRIDADLNPHAQIDGVADALNVDIAIIDSGIDADHPDLNVAGGVRFYTQTTGRPSDRGTVSDGNFDDDNGHGTHVAGTAAALDNDIGVVGVAPGARLWGVKVLDASGSGYLSDIIAGVEWVTQNADVIEVANMSLGGQGVSATYHEAIKKSVQAGVVYVAAAGNDYRDILGSDFQFGTADDTIPAAYPEVATISAIADTDGTPGGLGAPTAFADYFGSYQDDTFADFSNFSNSDSHNDSWYLGTDSGGLPNNPVSSPGLGIDLMLPGVDILSTYRGGGYATSSGTSMASPHAAGLAALQIAAVGRAQNTAEVYAIRQALIDQGKSWTSSEGLQLPSPPSPNPDSPDKHMENLGWAGPAGEVNLPPAVSIDSPLAGETLSGNATVTVTVTDVDPITSVQFFVDGVLASTDTEGADGWLFPWDTTLAAEGTRSLMAVATDERGATGSDSLEVIVDNVVSSGMHVSDLDGSAVAEGPRHWLASVIITVIDEVGEPVAGGTVSGSWSGGTTGSTSAVTDAAGQAVVSSDRIHDKSPSATWTVNAITHPSITYVASENSDSDGDSDGTSIEVQRSTAAGNQSRAAVPLDAFATRQEPASEESVRELESIVRADASLRGKTAKSRSFRGQADAADPLPTEANARVENADSAPVSNELGSWQRGVDAALAVEQEFS